MAQLLAIEDGRIADDDDNGDHPAPVDVAPVAPAALTDETSSIATTIPEQTPDEPVDSLPLSPVPAAPEEEFIESQWRLEDDSQANDEVRSSEVDAFAMESINTDSLPLEEPNMEVPALAGKTLDSKDDESPSQKNGEPGSAASDVGEAPAGSVDGMSPSATPTKDTLICLNFQE